MLPELTIYAKQKSKYLLPPVVFEDPSIKVNVNLRSTIRFTTFKLDTFNFNPKED
jgi:hypothetical protein